MCCQHKFDGFIKHKKVLKKDNKKTNKKSYSITVSEANNLVTTAGVFFVCLSRNTFSNKVYKLHSPF